MHGNGRPPIFPLLFDGRGRLMEILREDDEIYMRFGQVYLTTGYPGVVKAWHYHKVQHDHFCVIKGMMKVALYDARDGSPTKGEVNEFFLGEHRPIVLRIPPLVYHGFKAVGTEEALLINVSTQTYKQMPDRKQRGSNARPMRSERR
jgi:dTDP-4-dehydrorhamnose 3,5-epimerase